MIDVILVQSDGMHEPATALVGVSPFRKVITPVHEQLFVSATVWEIRFPVLEVCRPVVRGCVVSCR